MYIGTQVTQVSLNIQRARFFTVGAGCSYQMQQRRLPQLQRMICCLSLAPVSFLCCYGWFPKATVTQPLLDGTLKVASLVICITASKPTLECHTLLF